MANVYLMPPHPFQQGDVHVKLDSTRNVKVYKWDNTRGWVLAGFSSKRMGTIAKVDLKYVEIAKQWCVGNTIEAWIRD